MRTSSKRSDNSADVAGGNIVESCRRLKIEFSSEKRKFIKQNRSKKKKRGKLLYNVLLLSPFAACTSHKKATSLPNLIAFNA